MIARLLLRTAWGSVVLSTLLLAAAFALRSEQPPPLLMRFRNGLDMHVLLYDPAIDRELPLDPIAIGAPSLLWSPNGRWVIYRDQSGAIAAYNLATGQNHIISANQPDTINPISWSPDSRWLLLREINQSDILYVAFNDTAFEEPRRLDIGIYDVQWSPDSRHLYVRDVLQALSVIDVTCLEERASCIRSLVPNHQPVEQLAGWMPDGHDLMIVSLSETSNRPQVYSLNPDTGATRLLIAEPLPGGLPVWSPDGQRLAAALLLPAGADEEPGSEGIAGAYLIDATTQTQSLIWTGIVGDLSWTPDGSLLAFDLISRVDNRHSVWIYDRAADHAYTLTPTQSFESIPIWGVFRGRALNPVGLLALDGAALAVLWLTRRRALST